MSSDKTYPPSAHRLKEARKKGEVIKSADIGSVTAIGFVLLGLLITAQAFVDLARAVGQIAFDVNLIESSSTTGLMTGILLMSMKVVLLPLAFGALGGLAGMFFQVKANLSFHPIIPKLENLNPAQGIKKIFSVNGLIDLLLNMVKAFAVAYVLYVYINGLIYDVGSLGNANLTSYLPFTIEVVYKLFVLGVCPLIVIALADYGYRHWKFIKDKMMSREDLKQEHKQNDGDPQIKGKRKQLAREMANQDLAKAVKKARFVVMNPTHVAVVVQYEDGSGTLPVVSVKGLDERALLIKKLAEKNGVPVIRNVKLARQLYTEVQEGAPITGEVLEAIAEILGWLRVLAATK